MLHHIDIYVQNLDKQTEFWSWFLTELGYQQFQKWETGISWKKGDFYYVISVGDSQLIAEPYQKGRIGLNHLAFATEKRQTVDALSLQVEAHGGTILYATDYPYAGGSKHYALYFNDPEGMKMELVATEEV
ncbi:VOC family protein [Carnobacterium gallinarum]|uniref:VOC family protein n=1 Tax=Carnobacterium gallinarum TaxID=2749 RepID=UPI0005503E26|nr:VOC family protein [Carnobacterium gallinarum]